MGNLITLTYPYGKVVTYLYDAGGNMTNMAGHFFDHSAGNRATDHNGETATFDADGNMTYGPLDGVYDHFAYDPLNRPYPPGAQNMPMTGKAQESQAAGFRI